jgi:hypothetical protein
MAAQQSERVINPRMADEPYDTAIAGTLSELTFSAACEAINLPACAWSWLYVGGESRKT